MALRLHAITLADANYNPPTGDGSGTATGPKLIPFRDLCAVVSEQRTFTLNETNAELVNQHRAIVDSVFKGATVLPAPVGVVFRAPDVLKRWMELHYVSLTGALEFVEDRAVARVHVVRAEGSSDDLETGSDLAAAAAESLRALRRYAVAAVPLRLEEITGLALSSAFLVERSAWKAFLGATDEQQSAHHLLRFSVSGPWAPYDFVHMQFGG
jgi:hypothetical protein